MKKTDFNKVYAEYLKSNDWFEKRNIVLNRDNHTCQACLKAPATQVHHITYERVFDEPLFHLQSVCEECHKKIHDKKTDIERSKKYLPSGLEVKTGSRNRKVIVEKEKSIFVIEVNGIKWEMGGNIYHPNHGDGVITSIDKRDGDILLEVEFNSGRSGRLFPNYTPIARTKEEYEKLLDTSGLEELIKDLKDK